MTDLQIAQFVHETLSNFRVLNGQTPYPAFQDIPKENLDLYLGAIEGIRTGKIWTYSAIHQYWEEYAKVHNPEHPCIIPYKELSKYEKQKDMICFDLIDTFVEL